MIRVTVNNRGVQAIPLSPVTVGAEGIVAAFLFSDDWAGLAKTAIFKGSGEEVEKIILNNECTVPPEVLAEAGDMLQVGVYGNDGHGTTIRPTVWGVVGRIEDGAISEDAGQTGTTPSWAAQVQNAVQEAITTANNAVIAAEENADDSEAWAVGTRDGKAIPETDPAHQNYAKYWAEQAAASATEGAESASAASGKANEAAASAGTASNKAGEAATSAGNAAASAEAANAAKTAAQNAQTAAEQAKAGAETARDASSSSASQAAESATQAAGSASDAAQSATAAHGSESAAATSAQNAAASEAAAATSARNAGNSASAAATSETNAANSATAAAGSAGNAATSEQNASASATAAANSVTAAQTAQSAAEDAQGAAETAAASVSSSAAQIAQNTSDISDLNRHLSDFDPLYSTLMEQGSLSATGTGRPLSYVDSSNAIRTADFSPWEPGMSVHLKDGFEARLLLCDSSGNYIAASLWSQNPTSSSSADLVKVVVRRQSLTAITPDETMQAIVSTDIPLTIVYPKANESDFTDFKAKIEAATTTLVESNAYYLENVTPERSSGILDRWNNSITNGEHYSIPVAYGERYWLLGYKWGSDYAGYYLRKNGAIVSYDNTTPNGVMRNWDVTIPDGVDELYLNSQYSFGAIYKKVPCRAKPYSKWAGKKIAWFGTSIPERSTYNTIIGYPEYVGTLLGATVYNEAVGSSCARRGFKTAESADDPYGWTGMGIAALWNMGSTIAEKNEIISNWESKWRSLTGYNAAMTDEISAKALACSYENKLVQKYIIDNPVDLYVFDHGYNDWKTGDLDMNANDPFDMSTFQGAMNTYIKLILEANPRARIVIISHYEDQERAGLIEMQKGEAEYWNLPFCKIYEKLGWANNRQITTTGYWSNGVWIESGGTSQTLSLKQYHMPDGRHPNKDRTGRACMDIANVIADYIDSIAPAN